MSFVAFCDCGSCGKWVWIWTCAKHKTDICQLTKLQINEVSLQGLFNYINSKSMHIYSLYPNFYAVVLKLFFYDFFCKITPMWESAKNDNVAIKTNEKPELLMVITLHYLFHRKVHWKLHFVWKFEAESCDSFFYLEFSFLKSLKCRSPRTATKKRVVGGHFVCFGNVSTRFYREKVCFFLTTHL